MPKVRKTAHREADKAAIKCKIGKDGKPRTTDKDTLTVMMAVMV
jgi:hypothetical protein